MDNKFITTYVLDKYDKTYGLINERIGERVMALEFSLISLIAFAIPMLLSHPQIITGSIVNAILIYSSLRFRAKYILPLIVLPSISAVVKGMLFGPATPLLIFLMPFIWVGNAAIIYAMKDMFVEKKKHYILSLIMGAFIKALIIGGGAFIVSQFIKLPTILLIGMSIMQIITATIGGLLVYIGMKLINVEV